MPWYLYTTYHVLKLSCASMAGRDLGYENKEVVTLNDLPTDYSKTCYKIILKIGHFLIAI